MNALVRLRKKTGAGEREEATGGESALVTLLWSIPYAEGAGVASQPVEQLREMIEVIVVVCGVFSLTVSEATTEIIYLRTKGMSGPAAIFSLEAAGQLYNQTNDFVYLGGNINHNADLSIEVDRRIHTQRMAQLPDVHPRTVRPTERTPRFKIRMLRAEVLGTMLYGCVTWSPCACPFDTLRRAHHNSLTRCIV